MFTRIIVGAEIAAALVWAAPASASPTSVVAVAINPQTGTGSTAYGGGKPIEYAVQDAIDACNLAQGPGCVYAGATVNGCVGIAFYQGSFRWATAPTIAVAEGAAKSKLNAPGGNPVLSAACADGTNDGFAPGL
jgi:hypothetical protein